MPELAALRVLTRSLERARLLDPVIRFEARVVRSLVGSGGLRDLLHGIPFGHPIHPLLIQVPLGAWISAAALDLTPGNGRGARLLIGTGMLAAVPAASAGFTDWAELDPEQQRVGYVHAMVNFTAMSLYGMSWWERRHGSTARGKLLGLAGLTVVSVGGYLGGHLSYRQRAGVSPDGSVPFDGADTGM
jgi:uncharacterized membrane protein